MAAFDEHTIERFPQRAIASFRFKAIDVPEDVVKGTSVARQAEKCGKKSLLTETLRVLHFQRDQCGQCDVHTSRSLPLTEVGQNSRRG